MDRDIDKAIEKATERTRSAEERLVRTPIESPEIVAQANEVERLSEDLHELATDAVKEADHPD